MEENKNVADGISRSKQKRIDRQKQESKKKRDGIVVKAVSAVVILAIVALAVWAIATSIAKKADTIVASNDYSAQINDNGFIKGVKASDYIDLCDYLNIEVPLADVEYSEESIQEDIDDLLANHQILKTEDIVIADGDKVNIDYVGTIDGVEFDGGNSGGNGSDLEIGSGTFIDNFEEQLIGYKPGEVAIVNVTFPEDYGTEDLAGKEAEFTVTINGVYVTPEFDDDFVAAYCADVADTVDEYKQYLKDSNYEDSLTEYVTDYLNDNSTIKKYPKKYLRNVESTAKYSDEESFEYMNQMYEQYYGSGFSSFEEYTGMSEEEYLDTLVSDCESTVKSNLVYQAILENEGITLSPDELKAQYDDENYTEMVDTYGQGYLMLNVIEEKAIEIAKSHVTVK